MFANCASAISVTRYGVVDAIPELSEVSDLYSSFKEKIHERNV